MVIQKHICKLRIEFQKTKCNEQIADFMNLKYQVKAN